MAQLIGKHLGDYRIVEQIGKGGMATIYKAVHTHSQREVALKVLPPYYAEHDSSFVSRFKREAASINALQHPHILSGLDSGQHDGYAYIVMEYIPAGTLKDLLAERDLSLGEIANLISQIASALDYAHQQGVVHRDVKPSNILLPQPDVALLTDFGLARIVDGSLLTQTGMTVGTPAYMSPEQGTGGAIDPRTDIYSLGVMLYEMVVGEVPFTAETPMAIVVKHITEPLPMPRSRKPDLPEPVQRVILKALAKQPSERFQTANEFAEALSAAAAPEAGWIAAEHATIALPEQPEMPSDAGHLQPVSVTPRPKPASWGWRIAALAFAAFATLDLFAVAAYWAFNTFVRAPQPTAEPVAQQTLVAPQSTAIGQQPSAGGPSGPGGEAGFDQDSPEPPLPAPPEVDPADFQPDPWAIAYTAIDEGNLNRARAAFYVGLLAEPERVGELFDAIHRIYADYGALQAGEVLEIAIQAVPEELERVENYLWIGQLLNEGGRYGPAAHKFQYILRLDPTHQEAYFELTTLMHTLTGPGMQNLVAQLESILEEGHESAGLYNALSVAYREAGRYPEAVEFSTLAVELDPEDPLLIIDLAFAYLDNQQPNEARENADIAADIARDDPDLLVLTAYVYQDLEDYGTALTLLEQAVDLAPADGWAHYELAYTRAVLGFPDGDLLDGLERASALAGQDADLWLNIGWLYQDLGYCPQAEDAFTQSLLIAPGDLDALDGFEACQ